MEKLIDEKLKYRDFVNAFLTRRNIAETLPTLVWLRTQKVGSLETKQIATQKVEMEVNVLDEMISEVDSEEGK